MAHEIAPESTESDAGPESGPASDGDAQDAREARYGQACGDPGASTRRLPNENVSRWAGRAAMQCADAELAPLRARVAELEADVAQVRASWERECGNLELAHRQIERLHNAMSGHRRAMEALIAKAENRDPATVAATGEPFRNWVLTSELRAALAAAGPAASDGEGATSEATYATSHGYTPSTTKFGGVESCRVMLARYVCPYSREEHDPNLPPVDVDVFGYRRPASPVVAPSATDEGGA